MLINNISKELKGYEVVVDKNEKLALLPNFMNIIQVL